MIVKNLINPLSLLALAILTLSEICFAINSFNYQFPANDYSPDSIFAFFLMLFLINLGLKIGFDKNTYLRQVGKEIFLFFAVMYVIVIATNAAQLTPFAPIDKHILSFQSRLHINMNAILDLTANYPNFKYLLGFSYDSLAYQMALIPLVLILFGRFKLLREYYFLMLCTTLIGFSFYYFFPTTAPASVITNPLFSDEQIATGLKFNQIHQHIEPTTMAGGLIAFPSFHVIWALLALYLVKEWFFVFVCLTIFNSIIILSCVLLGWHYVIDIFGGVLLLLAAFYCLKLSQLRC